jgi:phage tail-like protein
MAGSVSAALSATRFELSIGDQQVVLFSELKTVTSALELPAFISAPSEMHFDVATGRQLPPCVVLKRRLTPGIELAAWHEQAILGSIAAASRTCMLTMLGAKGDAVARYQLTEAWPSKIEIGALDSGILTETVTLTCRLLQRVSV